MGSQLDYSNRAAKFTNVAAAATTVIKSGEGILHRIVVNTALANGTLTIYDNTAGSGTKIGTVTVPAAVLLNHFVLEFGLQFSTGLTIVGATANIDYTAVYS